MLLRRRTSRVVSFLVALMAIVLTAAVGYSPAGEDAGWRKKFDETYRLRDGEDARLIPVPYIPERLDFFRATWKTDDVTSTSRNQALFRWKGQRAQYEYTQTGGGTLASAMFMAGVRRIDLEGADDLLRIQVLGDWVLRAGRDRAALVAGIERAVREATGRKVRIELAHTPRPVLVASGHYTLRQAADAKDNKRVSLYVDNPADTKGGGGTVPLTDFLDVVGDCIGKKVVDETGDKVNVPYSLSDAAVNIDGDADKAALLIQHVAEQTSLVLKEEDRQVPVWRITEEGVKPKGL